jgi:hypothetical protein
MMARTIAVGTLLVALIQAAWASPVTLQAQALLTTPGIIAVDQQNVTAIQFCEPIGWLAYKAPWLHAQISQQDRRVLLLDVSAASGRTSAAVWIEGQGAPLQLQIRASGTLVPDHLYFVSCATQPQKPAVQSPSLQPPTAPRQSGPSENSSVSTKPAVAGPTAPIQPVAGASSIDSTKPVVASPAAASCDTPATTWDAFLSGLSPHQWDLLRDLMGSPTKGAYFAFTASLSPEQAVSWATLYAGPPAKK